MLAPTLVTDIADSEEVLPVTGGTDRPGVLVRWNGEMRQLPQSVDDLMRDFGVLFYDQVGLDPHVDAMERILITGVLAQGVQYVVDTPRADAAYDRAAKLLTFIREAFKRLPCAMELLVFEMATAARRHGHKLSEAVWTTEKILPNYGPQLIYQDIKPKPLPVYAFVQDGYANTLGVVPVAGAYSRTYQRVNGERVVVSEGQATVGGVPLYPMAKFPTLVWNPANRDPRGNSAYRTIFGAWYKKRQTEPGLLAYLARFGQPSLELTMPTQTPDKVTVDGVEYTTADWYKAQGEAFQAGGVLVLPNGATATLQEANGDGNAYLNAEKLWNNEIAMGLTGQTLATGEGQHRSGADSATHQDMLGLLVTFLKGWVGDWINRQLIAPLIVANFGVAALPYAPRVDLGRISPEDLAAMVNAISQLAGQGYWLNARVPPDVRAELDTRMGLPQSQTGAIAPTGQPTDAPPQPPTAPQSQPQEAPA